MSPSDVEGSRAKEETVRIAIPLVQERLTAHFGQCEMFALIDVDLESKSVLGRGDVKAPPHQPGFLPRWLAERGVQVIIAGGMGHRAQSILAEEGIRVVTGASAETPERLVRDYLAGTLEVGENSCDHEATGGLGPDDAGPDRRCSDWRRGRRSNPLGR